MARPLSVIFEKSCPQAVSEGWQDAFPAPFLLLWPWDKPVGLFGQTILPKMPLFLTTLLPHRPSSPGPVIRGQPPWLVRVFCL